MIWLLSYVFGFVHTWLMRIARKNGVTRELAIALMTQTISYLPTQDRKSALVTVWLNAVGQIYVVPSEPQARKTGELAH